MQRKSGHRVRPGHDSDPGPMEGGDHLEHRLERFVVALIFPVGYGQSHLPDTRGAPTAANDRRRGLSPAQPCPDDP